MFLHAEGCMFLHAEGCMFVFVINSVLTSFSVDAGCL